jgi:hypothetical protein
MKGNGKITSLMVKENLHIQMEGSTKEIGSTIFNKAKAVINMQTDPFIKVSGRVAASMDMEYKLGNWEKNMKGAGYLEKKMAMESYISLMEAFIKEIFNVMKFMEKELIIGSILALMKVIGSIIFKAEEV